jgi:hypothetical protein
VAEWTLSDAWVFSCLSGPGPEHGAALWQVLFHADLINHLVLGEGEFTVAGGRLVAAGLMGADVAADRYWLTAAGYALRQRLLPDPQNYVWYDAVLPGLRSLGEPAPDVLSLPEGAFRRASKRHRKEFWATVRRIDAERRAAE